MLTTIYLHGELGAKFGRKWKLAVSSTAEALRAIEANRPGLFAYLNDAGDRGVAFKVKVDGEVIGEERVQFQKRGAVIRVSPVVSGAKDGATQVIVGAVLVALAVVSQQYQFLPGLLSGGTGIVGGYLGTFVGALGLSMAIGGVAQVLANQPKGEKKDDKPSYLFSGPINSVQQGGPVPICYGGPIIVGSQVVSGGIYSEDVSAYQRGVVQEGPFTSDPDYPNYAGSTAPTNLLGRSLQTKQRARFLDAICEGKIKGLCDAAGNVLSYEDRNKGIFFESTQVQADDGRVQFNEFSTAFRPGSVTQTPIPGFPDAETEVSVETEVIKGSDKIANAITRTIPAGSHTAVRVTIRIPALFEVDSKGGRKGAAVHFSIQIKRSAESTWTEVVGSNPLPNGELDGLVQGEATDPSSLAFRIPLPGTGPWDIRVLKENADAADETKLQSKLVWQSYAVLTDGRFTYRHTAMVGSEVSSEKFQSVPARWFRMLGKLIRVPSNYNPETRDYTGAWDGKFAGADIELSANYTAGSLTLAVNALAAALPVDSPIEIRHGGITYDAYLTADAAAGATLLSITPINHALTAGDTGYGFDLKFTTNPAWIMHDLCTAKRYGLGDYIPAQHLDIWALYTIGRYCDGVDASGNFVGVDDGNGGVEPRFAISTYIQSATDAFRLVSDIASAFRGMVYWGAGLISAVQDAPKEPRFSITNANVIDELFQYSNTSRKARHTRALVQFSDPNNFFKDDIETVDADDEVIERLGIREISVKTFGCISRGQARRTGEWLLLTEELEKETVIFKTGLEGARARPGDVIRIRDRSKTVNRMAGRLKAVGSGAVTLDAPAVIASGTHTLILAKTDGTHVELTITDGPGTYATLNVTGSLSGVVPNAVWILRSEALEPALFRVLNVHELERHIFEFTCLRYVPGKFAAVEEGIEITVPPTSDFPRPETPLSPPDITIEMAAIDTPSGTQRFLTATWSPSSSAYIASYILEYRAPAGEWRVIEGEAKGLSGQRVLVTELGEHSFRVFARNTLGFVSTPGMAASYTLAEIDDPAAPTALAATAQTDGIFLTWQNPASPNLTVVEVQESLDGTFTDPPVAPSPVIGTAPADKDVKGSFHRGGIVSSRHRWYRIRARNKAGGRSAWTSAVDTTAIVAPTGPPGAPGAPGDSLIVEYSVDGSTSWHSTFTTGDLYRREKIGAGGTWSSAIRIVGINGTNGTRGSRTFYAATTGTSWSNTEADAAITGMGVTKVPLDTVTLYKTSAGYSETRYWDGTAWLVVTQVIDGALIVHGTIGSDQIIAGISLTSPLILGGTFKLNGASTVCSNTADGSDNSIVRLNGGGSDGQSRGGQVDVLGNEYTTFPGYNGSVLLTPGAHGNGTVRLRDNTGADRLVVDASGKIVINSAGGSAALEIVGSAAVSSIRNYNYGVNTPNYEGLVAGGNSVSPSAVLSGRIVAFKLLGHTGSGFSSVGAQIRLRTAQNWSTSACGSEIEFRVTPNNTTAEISAANLSNAGDFSVYRDLSGGRDLFSTGVGATKVGFLNAAGASSPDTYVGLRYDAGNNRAELAALSGGVAWRDVLIAPNANIMFGTHAALGGETITGYITIKDAAGNPRKLAVLS